MLLQKESGAVCCAAVLTEKDPAWQDLTPALYLHNFVGAVSVPGEAHAFCSMRRNMPVPTESVFSGLTAPGRIPA